jgi:hypothetical protein
VVTMAPVQAPVCIEEQSHLVIKDLEIQEVCDSEVKNLLDPDR